MIVCGIPFDATTTQELRMIRDEIGKEIKNRENAAKVGEWNTVRQAVKNWCDKYGPITLGGAGKIDHRSFGSLPGDILIL